MQHKLEGLLLSALAYLLWLINLGVGIVAVIQTQSALDVTVPLRGGSQYTLNLMNQLSLLVGGFIVFIYSIFLHSHYHESIVQPGQSEDGSAGDRPPGFAGRAVRVLLRRFTVTTAVLLAVIVLALVILELAMP